MGAVPDSAQRDAEDLIEELRRFRERVQLPEDAPTPEDLIRKDRGAGHCMRDAGR
jgi:hypothetical protein